ncbi:MAG: diacylglycerol kinase family lipid kinase [Thermodesulfovibrionales bacterium]|nr:diacylglycerol kinase family lipid kinase [Thermodesulfovibrionales bacterium]
MKSLIVLIFNPTAKRASDKKIVRASHFLKSRGYKVEVLFTEQKGDAESLAREAIKESPSMIIAAGGDGTFNEVINGIAGSEIPMAILPLGTTNVLAKELSVPQVVEDAMEVVLSSAPKTVSLGRIVRSSALSNSERVSRYFCLMAGIGFDGEAVFRISETLKKISGKGAYIYSGIKTLSGFNPGELIFDIDGRTYSGYSAVISKAAKYGGNFKITPDAKLTDPLLYICLFKGKKRLDILRYVFGIIVGRHLRFRDVEYVKATTVEVKGNAHVQIDGDYFGKTPAKVEIVPNIVRLLF